ncbi:hypothetical protein [Paenibacillus flagellatus]|uniref:Uncharacterized protein n=1 Tax=Paenibacillus flagellatus TaxID=2211139 RepID=A0A2V5K538_9BACL|nr:hypothetical protein [Paenibacillus flagellatus]PYI54431.1 hypothetical protein DLM86_13250 [Paenibacillus flagellatus]
MYSQQNSSFFGNASAFGAPVSSQYRGIQKPYQPVGLVQSQYGQNQSFGTSTQYQPTSAFGAQSTNAFHTANYRGNQQGHDNYLRADSTNPSQFGGSAAGASFGTISQSSQFGIGSSAFGGGASSYQNQNPNAFHTANYRGNQQGHDNYLRADSTNPSQSAFGFAGSSVQSQYQPQSQFQGQFQNQFQSQSSVSPQSFHTANYRGNQQGHDSYLRADSTQPTNAFSGFGASSYRF